ncbi:FxsA family protein [Photobacterium ganghwense]|uniref:Exclusion suppressor FxsA n=1 Tax=Photobacterium ganghwense TaxID=320778 RepID=A0A0J1HDJ4_9GAMM|nr:FxsA family protein [Photobacterium ganghwense]KLV09693.1 exclusion suppressor FxsA [Photobacterium ganghwense]MBV1841027.1 membrane protein FxsA [Photobacterium ganghwense]PSU04754.1 membrane protein FxsA [Photobacterium ganghwense]QSV13917.1 membrane protein FxsA [Photobacterium ganghwense]
MFPILLFLFIVVPIIEIALFIQVGGFLGLWPTVGLVLVTAVVGASLVRSQGIATLLSVQNRLQQGELPAQQIVEGVMLAVAGVLLLTPGFMTDAMGMLALLPGPRAMLAKQLMKRVKVHGMAAGSGFSAGFGGSQDFHQGPFSRQDHNPFNSQGGDVFDGEYERKDAKDKRADSDDDDTPRLR